MKKILFLCALSVMLVSCVPSEDNKTKIDETPTVFRFSDLNRYMNFHTIMTDQKISMKIMSKVDSINQYSFGFASEIRQLYHGKASGVSVKTKYYFQELGEASVVCSVSKFDSVLFWESIQLNSKIALKKWTEIERVFDFKKTYSGDERLSVYVWSPKGNTAYIEDLVISPKE